MTGISRAVARSPAVSNLGATALAAKRKVAIPVTTASRAPKTIVAVRGVPPMRVTT
jgi:hypothetical protein